MSRARPASWKTASHQFSLMLLHLYTILIAAQCIGLSTTHSRCLRPVFRHVRHACLYPSSMCRLSLLPASRHASPTCHAFMHLPHPPPSYGPHMSCSHVQPTWTTLFSLQCPHAIHYHTPYCTAFMPSPYIICRCSMQMTHHHIGPIYAAHILYHNRMQTVHHIFPTTMAHIHAPHHIP